MKFYQLHSEQLTIENFRGIIYKYSVFILCFVWFIFGNIVFYNIIQNMGYLTNHIVKEIPVEKYITRKIIVKQKVSKYPLDHEMQIASRYICKTNRRISKSIANRIAYEIYTQSRKANVNPELILAIIKVESHFNTYAENQSTKAKSLMQVLDGGPNMEINWDRIFNIDYNIEMGIKIFKEHLRLKNGDLNGALVGYVGGDKKYIEAVKVTMSDFLMFKQSKIQ